MSSSGGTDFVTIFVISLVLYLLLKLLQRISEKWKVMMKARVQKVIDARKLVKDQFRTLNGYSWDFIIVFKVKPKENKIDNNDVKIEEKKKNSLKSILNRLSNAGLQTKLFYSCQHDEVYVKIRAPLHRLLAEADRLEYKLLLEPAIVAGLLAEGNLNGPIEKQWKPVYIPAVSEETKIAPTEYIYAPYDSENERALLMYKKWSNNTILRGVDRLKLMNNIFMNRICDGGCDTDFNKLTKLGYIEGYTPLHDLVELRILEDKWLRFVQFPWNQNVNDAKDYYGEKIGLYFGWLGHYTTWLIYISFIGFIAWVVVAANDNNPNTSFMPYFSVFVAIWSTLYLESWKRKENYYAMIWGTEGYELDEQVRPEFKGFQIPSPVNGATYEYFPVLEYILRQLKSSIVITICILVVIGAVGSIFLLRIVLTASKSLNSSGIQLGGIIASLLNAIQISIMNELYGRVAIYLNNYENHRTDTDYEDSLISKTFIFQFVNSFSALFYIAFIKMTILDEDPCVGDCMKELQTTLGTIFITRLATGSLISILGPYITQRLKKDDEMKGITNKNDVSEVELSFTAPEYHHMLGTFNDYAEMMIQFGYATMFITAFPLATVLALISNYIKMRVDAWKLCQLFRRPEPKTVEDIGAWFYILNIISLFAVLVNSALIAFTSTITINTTFTGKIWIFLGTSIGVLLLKYVINIYIPDVPLDVDIQLQRKKYIIDKLFYDIRDEDDDFKIVASKTEYIIRITDDDPL